MQKSTIILSILLTLTLTSGCLNQNAKSEKTKAPEYMTQEDIDEQKALNDFGATIKIPTEEKMKEIEGWDTLTVKDWNLKIKYPLDYVYDFIDDPEGIYLAMYSFQQKNKDENRDPKIYLQIKKGDFDTVLENIESTMEVNVKKQVTINNVVGVKLTGVSGDIVYLLPWMKNTLILKNPSISLEETFYDMVRTLVLEQ